MFGVTDYSAFVIAFVVLLVLPGPGNAYCLAVVLLTRFLADRLRANPAVARYLEKLAGVCLVGFGLKLAASR